MSGNFASQVSYRRVLETYLGLIRHMVWRHHRMQVVAKCCFWAYWLWPQIRWGTLPNVLVRLDRLPRRGLVAQTGLSPEAIAQTARAVVVRLPRFGVGECLLRSLVIYAMLRCQRQAGIMFVLGAGSLDEVGRPSLHCWIEANGQPLLEMVNPYCRFQVLLRHRMPTAS